MARGERLSLHLVSLVAELGFEGISWAWEEEKTAWDAGISTWEEKESTWEGEKPRCEFCPLSCGATKGACRRV